MSFKIYLSKKSQVQKQCSYCLKGYLYIPLHKL